MSKKAGKLVDQDMLNLIRLFYPYANPHTVDAGLNENFLIFIAGNCERIEQDFWGACGFYFRDVMSFGDLRGEVGKGERCCE